MEKLKIKSSPVFVVGCVLLVVIILTALSMAAYGLIDVRTEEQKAADKKQQEINELMADASFQYGVEAINYVSGYNIYNVVTINSVSHLKSSNKYVLIKYIDSFGSAREITYSATKKTMYPNGNIYYNELGTKLSGDLYFGTSSPSPVTTFKGEKLSIMLEVAGWR